MWSLDLCWHIPAQFCVIVWSPSLCRNIPAEPEPFDLAMCMLMHELSGWVFKA